MDVRHDVEMEVSNRALLQAIDTCLTNHSYKKEDVNGMLVVVGEGSFTSTRLATTVANTFAYVLQIPVLAVSKEQAQNPQAMISFLADQPKGQYISATYSAPPHIG